MMLVRDRVTFNQSAYPRPVRLAPSAPARSQPGGGYLGDRAMKHGKTNTPTWRTWRNIKKRCYNRNYEYYGRYGGRGITVCKRWRDSFEVFLEDVGERPGLGYSLERINNNGNYEPGNCRWADQKQQSRNRESSFLVTYRGETRCLAEWAEIVGIPYRILYKRLSPAWDVEEAMTTPVGRRGPRSGSPQGHLLHQETLTR